jgi:small subunit ribosomal protein S16
MDARSPRDGRVIEELGTYDPMVPETDARAILKGERIAYWIGVGAQPTPKVGTLIKKYGLNGTHLEAQAAAIGRLSTRRAASVSKARDTAISREMPAKEEPKPAASEEITEAETTEAATESVAERGEE